MWRTAIRRHNWFAPPACRSCSPSSTGGGGGDTVSQFAGLAAILSYSRAAEEEADSFAMEAMVASAIDPLGLKSFFEKILAEEKGDGSGKDLRPDRTDLRNSSGHGRTHRKIIPLPDGITASR